ncbi:Uncharacterised protein [Vibrio cholerae]|nr:Uncharacterised protein [Vibrio cholerae]
MRLLLIISSRSGGGISTYRKGWLRSALWLFWAQGVNLSHFSQLSVVYGRSLSPLCAAISSLSFSQNPSRTERRRGFASSACPSGAWTR